MQLIALQLRYELILFVFLHADAAYVVTFESVWIIDMPLQPPGNSCLPLLLSIVFYSQVNQKKGCNDHNNNDQRVELKILVSTEE